MGEYSLAIIVVIGAPIYLYIMVRFLASAIFRSYFETKREFSNPKKEVV
jgi:hypothetical protein